MFYCCLGLYPKECQPYRNTYHKGDQIMRGNLDAFVLRPRHARRIATQCQGHGKIISPSQHSLQERYENRQQGFDPENEATTFNVNASRFLGFLNTIAFLKKQRDETDRQHDEQGDFPNRDFDILKWSEIPFHCPDHIQGRCRQGHQRGNPNGTCQLHADDKSMLKSLLGGIG